MPARPIKTDEEVRQIARDLYAEGKLTVRALRTAAGGGDPGRMSQIAGMVRDEEEALSQHLAAATELANTGGTAVLAPPALADAFERGKEVAIALIHQARSEEADRGRAAEEALRAKHATATGDFERRIAGLTTDLAELREVSTDLEKNLENAQAEILSKVQEIAQRRESESEARREIAERDRAIRSLQTDVDEARTCLTREREEAATALGEVRRENQRNCDRADAAEKRADVACAEATAARDRREEAERTLDRVRAEFERSTSDLRVERSKAEALAADLRVAQSELAAAREEIAGLRAKTGAQLDMASQLENLMKQVSSIPAAPASKGKKKASQ